MTRRRFLANLGLASAALLLRFRPESAADMRIFFLDATFERTWDPTIPLSPRLTEGWWVVTENGVPFLKRVP